MKQFFKAFKNTGFTSYAIPALILAGFLLFLTVFNTASAKDALQKKTALTKSGLNLRDKADSAGKKLGLIPFGEAVDITETQTGEVTVSGKKGHWVKVKWKNLEGWAFDAFLGNEESSPLLDHFKSIEIQVTGGCDCMFHKDSGEDKFHGDCGSSGASAEPVDKSAVVSGNAIMFEYTYWECTKETYEDGDEGSCVESETKEFECTVDGNKILSTKKGKKLDTEVKCKLVKTK